MVGSGFNGKRGLEWKQPLIPSALQADGISFPVSKWYRQKKIYKYLKNVVIKGLFLYEYINL